MIKASLIFGTSKVKLVPQDLKHHQQHYQHHYQYFPIISVQSIYIILSYLANKQTEKHQLSHNLHCRGNKCQPHAFFSASHAFSLKFAQLKV